MKQTLSGQPTLYRPIGQSIAPQKFQEQIHLHKNLIQNIKNNHEKKLLISNSQLQEEETTKEINKQIPLREVKVMPQKWTASTPKDTKNQNVSETEKMLFQKKFKNFLNHRQQFQARAKEQRQRIIQQRKNLQAGHSLKDQDFENQYVDKDELMNDIKGENQFSSANEMLAFYEEITFGKKNKKNGVQLYHAQKIEYLFRREQFDYLIMLENGGDQRGLQNQLPTLNTSIKKETLLNYLFDEPAVMMLYSINPYQLGDQIAEFQTSNDGIVSFQDFSNFLLIDREPTYFQYSKQNLTQARKLGRGIKCMPIISKWIADDETYEWLIQIFRQIDILGDEKVQKQVLARKIRKEAEKKRILNMQIIQILNINKLITLDRVLYEIQFGHTQNDKITLQEFQGFLTKYHRLQTPEKDKLITKLILSGKYEPSYIFILGSQTLETLKQVFKSLQKFAQYFVLKQKFVQKLIKSVQFTKIRGLSVRSQGNRYVKKQSIQQTLVRFLNEAETYVDIEEVLQFFSNRGRPRKVQHQIYMTNLSIQLAKIQHEERLKQQKKLSEGDYSTSSDQQQFQNSLKEKKTQRRKDKLASIRACENYTEGKKFVITVPAPFSFGMGTKQKSKISIRQAKVKKMLEQKRRAEDESMQPIKPQPVPSHVRQDLYQKIMKEQERQRKQRLQKFRLQSQQNMYPISAHLLQKRKSKSIYYTGSSQHKFIAKPLPWYCQVNLLERIQKEKQERRQRILEQIINKHNDFDLPEGFKKMITRGQNSEKQKDRQRAISKTTANDPNLTFNPQIISSIPNFKVIHEHLEIDLQNKKQQKKQIEIVPFSFENRPYRSRTALEPKKPQNYDLKQSKQTERPKQETPNIPITMKYQALVNLRRKQQQEQQRVIDEQKRASAVRKMRQQKFAPYVRSVLRNSQHGDIAKSRAIIEERIKQFKKQEKRRKQVYEEEMIKIYTKVFNRPLLVQGQGERRNTHEDERRRLSNSGHKNRSKNKQDRQDPRENLQNFAQNYEMSHQIQEQYSKRQYNQHDDEKRRKAIEHPPRNYLMQDPNDERNHVQENYQQDDYEGQYLSENGRYTN